MSSPEAIAQLFEKARVYYQSGDYDNARQLCTEVLGSSPKHADALHMLGYIEHLKGDHAKGTALIQKALLINPSSPLFHNSLGNTLFAQAKYSSALDTFRKTIELKPDYADGHYNAGLACMACNDNKSAVKYFKKTISLKPNFIDAHTNMGNALMKSGLAGEAVTCFRKTLQTAPKEMATRVNLSLALQSIGHMKEAKQILQKTLEYIPENAEILFNLGIIYQRENKTAKAVECFQNALSSNPNDSRILYNLGTTFMESDDKVKALPFFEKVLTISPCDPDNLNNLGLIHYYFGNYENALDLYKKAIQCRSDFFKAYNNMGLTFKALGYTDKAIASFKKAMEIAPDFAETFHNLAEIQRETGALEKAADNCRKAIALQPDLIQAVTHYSYLLKSLCQWDEFSRISDNINPLIKKELEKSASMAETPFMNLIRVEDPGYNKKNADAFAAKTEKTVEKLNVNFSHPKHPGQVISQLQSQNQLQSQLPSQLSKENRHPGKKKITIGYLSANFKNHPMAHLLANLFRYHNRTDFSINAYSLGADDKSIYRQRFQEDADIFRDIRHLSHKDAATAIYHDKVDILVDLMGYTQGNRMEIAALRPAPIQVRYMGLAGTTGGRLFDYIITDEIVTPRDQQINYSEKFIYMPHTYQINDQHKIISNKPVSRKMYRLPEESFVFCSFNQSYKIDPAIFSTWIDILKAVDNSVLWLIPGNMIAKKNLIQAAQRHDLNENRLVFAENLPIEEHLARLQLADLALDTRSISGAATTSDALWAGIPVVTLLGNRFASRMSASILTAIGLEELITHTLEEYREVAASLAGNRSDRSRIGRIKHKLKSNSQSMPLFDTLGFTMNLERAYKKIHRIHVTGNSPQLIDLKKEISHLSTASALFSHEYSFPLNNIFMV